MSQKRIYIVIGTRAQLLKMAPVMALMETDGLEYDFIYTAQHKETIETTLRDFRLKNPDRTLYSRSEANTLLKFLGWSGAMMLHMCTPKNIFPEVGLILTHGDTATCAWAAIVGKLAKCTVAHIESGLRSFNILKPFPEELMRLITFKLSDMYFCPNRWAVDNLESYPGDKINMRANPLYDSVVEAMNSTANVTTPSDNFAIVSIHRFENIFTKRFETKIIPLLEKIASQGYNLLFVLHPSTREVLNKNNARLAKRLQAYPNIELTPRFPFFEFVKLLAAANFVITDGGSNQEELSYLGTPTLLFREVTERIEGLDENVKLSGFDEETVLDFVKYHDRLRRPFKRIGLSPSRIVVDHIRKLLTSSTVAGERQI